MTSYLKLLRLLRSLRLGVWVFVFPLLVSVLPAQTTSVVQVAADCTVAFNITAQLGTGPNGGSFDNRQTACNFWLVEYQNATQTFGTGAGFSAVTLAVQSSQDGITFVTMPGTVVFGQNPLTATTAASALINASAASYPPFVRVQATTATGGPGFLRGILLGYRTGGAVGVTSTSGTPAVQAAGGCTLQQPISLSASGNTRIINAGGTGTIRICHISFSTTAAEDITFSEGTGTNCGTGTANVTGPYKSVQSIALDPQTGGPITTQTVGDDFCINQSAAQILGGIVIYAKF
jgi:hypothetical protein